MTPDVHWASTNAGVETMNIGAAITGMRSRSVRMGGRAIPTSYLTSGSEVNVEYRCSS
jgi:hypothetical protein